jgi:hypothetical protein
MIVMNTEDGKVEADLPIGAGVDATKVDQGQAFASCRDGSLTVVGMKDGKFEVEGSVKTAEGARTMELDKATHRIFLPTADFEAATSGRSRTKPGTFEILVVGRE